MPRLLSEPALDSLLLDYAGWHKASTSIDMLLLEACHDAVLQSLGKSLVKDLLLSLPPAKFVNVLRAHPYRHLAPFRLRGASWITTIAARAKSYRGVVGVSKNVLAANFGPAQSNARQKSWKPQFPIDELLNELVALGGVRRDGTDFWKAMSRYCDREGIRHAADISTFIRFTNYFQREYKTRQSETAMPAAYRSAKSQIKKALLEGKSYFESEKAHPKRLI